MASGERGLLGIASFEAILIRELEFSCLEKKIIEVA